MEQSMKPDQWFTLWIAIISVAGGCIAAFISVWLGASLAFRSNRRSLRHERARTAAERCLIAIDQATDEYRRIERNLFRDQSNAERSIDKRVGEQIMVAYDNLMENEVPREAWLLEDKTITITIARCLRRSMQLHLNSFGSGATELCAEVQSLLPDLRNAGDMLRAAMLDKRVGELTEQDHDIIKMMLLGRHVKRKGLETS
jgi:hypothetical protein